MSDQNSETILNLTADIVAAHVANNTVAVGDVPMLIAKVHDALSLLGQDPQPAEEAPTPAVSVRASIKPDYLVCLEDGKKLKMLRRYLMTRYSMTPEDYRRKWNLPKDYPMVAPNYAEQRRSLAHSIGLGRKRDVADDVVATPEPEAAEAPKRGRKPKAAAPAPAPAPEPAGEDAPAPKRRGRPRKQPAEA
jgi:predicted transcriptional regulator